MQNLKFDPSNLLAKNIGRYGVVETDLAQYATLLENGHKVLLEARENGEKRIASMMEWLNLPYQREEVIDEIQNVAKSFRKFKNIVSIGIGGSYLGNRMLQDGLRSPYYNEFESLRNGCPRIFFNGKSLDPVSLNALLNNLDPKETGIVVISKSGGTTEPKVSFEILKWWLERRCGRDYWKHIIAVTDERQGILREWVKGMGKPIPTFPVPDGVGGRFSVLSPVGLITAAMANINIKELLAGAAAMEKMTQNLNLKDNPAYLYALLHTVLYQKRGINIAVMMPFADQLETFADWYVQLLAESLGKKYNKQGLVINTGRTPIPSVGPSDLHSTQQNNIEGEYNKAITFIRVEKPAIDLTIPHESNDYLADKQMSVVGDASQRGTEFALLSEGRPNCTISLPELTPYTLGQLIFFFEIATAMEGELLGVNTYDQPGVEGYKKNMFGRLGKAGFVANTFCGSIAPV
ncbi:MAG: glucose-6-phosphate isomerase [Candidatus Saganbacteria bacterium]|nr:glucose-6-phosphate isomerase [Candidatus Saganbacteria bacterium]